MPDPRGFCPHRVKNCCRNASLPGAILASWHAAGKERFTLFFLCFAARAASKRRPPKHRDKSQNAAFFLPIFAPVGPHERASGQSGRASLEEPEESNDPRAFDADAPP